jgi:hypothetical protein
MNVDIQKVLIIFFIIFIIFFCLNSNNLQTNTSLSPHNISVEPQPNFTTAGESVVVYKYLFLYFFVFICILYGLDGFKPNE